jgi:hypothetical protein
MTHYDRTYGTDWESLTADEAVERAYAIGVAERLGEPDREELERLYASVDSNYDRSMVELAYEQGRNEAREVAPRADSARGVWSRLVADDPVGIDAEPGPDRPHGLPESLSVAGMLSFDPPDSTDALDLPEFLDR